MYELGDGIETGRVEAGSSILVVGPPMSGKRELAYDVLAHGAASGDGTIIVSNQDSAERVLEEYGHRVDVDETTLSIVDCVTKHQGQGTIRDTDRIRYASSPEDMTGIGIKFTELIEEFYTQRGIERNRVFFNSVTTLLMYSDLETVFRFLHVFTSRIENANALGLFILQESAHDDRVMGTFNQLFDGVIRTRKDGPPEARLPTIEPTADT